MSVKKKIAIGVLVGLLAPILLYNLIVSFSNSASRKAPDRSMTAAEFQTAFNAAMADAGMSIDLDSVKPVPYAGKALKPVSVQCADGSTVHCTVALTGSRKNARVLAVLLRQSQPADGDAPWHLKRLALTLMQIFEAPLMEHPGVRLNGGVACSDVLAACANVRGDGSGDYDGLLIDGDCTHEISLRGVEEDGMVHLAVLLKMI